MQIEFKFMADGIVAEVEEWRPCPDFEPYEVSSFGRFRNKATGRMLGGTAHQWGYRNVGFTVNKKTQTKLAHRLVAMAFVEQPSLDCNQVNHINGNKADNRASNLEWVTPSRNMKHSWSSRVAK